MNINFKMTAIADEIRELSGTTGTMNLDAMATNIGDANDEVNSQVELLAQAVAALKGKSASGEQAVSIPTCKLTVVLSGVGSSSSLNTAYSTTYKDYSIKPVVSYFASNNASLINSYVPKGSIVFIPADNLSTVSGDGITIEKLVTSSYVIFSINSDAPDAITVTLSN